MVLSIEQNISKKEKLKQQKRYSYKLKSNEKAFIVISKESLKLI